MEASSVQILCKNLISSAIQRCRLLDDLCRVTVKLQLCPQFNPPLVRVSVSDTGTGSRLDDFQELNCPINLAGAWDGTISISTTRISDNEIHHATINLKETVSRERLIALPSTRKNNAKFSGTQVSLSTSERVDDLLADLTLFLRNMFILKIPKVAAELLVDWGNPLPLPSESCILAIECSPSRPSEANIECLKSGFEDYVLKHGYKINNICCSCFSTGEHLKVGAGIAQRTSVHNNSLVTEAVIIISEVSESTSCCRTSGLTTEILYFQEFAPCSISLSSCDALTSVKWEDYGLTLGRLSHQDGRAVLDWVDLPPYVQIDIVLHCYHKKVVPYSLYRNVDRINGKAVKLALTELKEKYDGILLSAHATKISKYVPGLAKTIASLVMSSNDSSFKEECTALLGLQSQSTEVNTVEDCIKEKIISVIWMNDRKPVRTREAPTFLFQDECSQRLGFLDEEYDEGEEVSSSLDL